MNRIFQILVKNHVFFLFIFLETSILFHLSSKQLIIGNSINKLSTSAQGRILGFERSIFEYFNLKDINEQLIKENYILFNQNIQLKKNTEIKKGEETSEFLVAKILKNSWNKNRNFIVINIGAKNGVMSQMPVMNNNSLVGMTVLVNKNFSTVISLINTSLMISAKIKNTGHFGTLSWDGIDYSILQLRDVPKNAVLTIGDTVVTSSYSNIFPEGLKIGKISKIKNEKSTNFMEIDVELFTDFTRLNSLYLREKKDKKERNQIEENISE